MVHSLMVDLRDDIQTMSFGSMVLDKELGSCLIRQSAKLSAHPIRKRITSVLNDSQAMLSGAS